MKMLIFNMTIDSAMSDGNKEIFWTNREKLNIMNFTFQSISNFEILNLPTRPSYIIQHELGIVEADIIFIHTALNGREKDKRELVCDGVNRDKPFYDKLFQCKTRIAPFDLSIESGDTFAVTYRAKNGGYRRLAISGEKQYFIGNEVRKMIDVKFDRDYPYHCTEKNDCTSSDMLKVTNEITKTAIRFTWNGWRDDLSKVARYALEVFKLEPDGTGALKEPYTDTVDNPVPLNITEFNETTSGVHTFSYRPDKPGVYSWILEVNDKANNSVYVRRIVIYDPVSTVTTDSSKRLYASSGNPNASFEWQTQNPLTAKITWKGHFLNSLHENEKFLNRVKHFPDSLYDGGSRNGYKKIPPEYDDYNGERTINAIPNERGIVRYDVAYYNGKDQQVAPSYRDQNLKFNETEQTIALDSALEDGRSLSVWVKAYDVLGNANEERLVLHYDSSKPLVQSLELKRNVGTDKMDYRSRIHVVGATDPHSGVKTIKYRFIAKSTGKIINNKEYEYENPKRDSIYCNEHPCDTNLPTGESFGKTIDLDFENCYAMNVSDVSTEVVRMEMDFYNSAGLYATEQIEIVNLTSLKGVNDYFGPTDIRVAETLSASSVKIMWNQAPSCYNQQGIDFTYRKAHSSDEKVFPVHKASNWFTMVNLDPGSTYILRLYTLYGDDERNPIKSEVSEFNFTTSK
ncbi:uncharacterized protein LOC134270731 [Saccostrea cucullata]|uniref:uncharacterized protein LOC134270731 n=1 Tax=Saccostrea cuccullata TaxID=36930 RepID=UPI002ED27A40